jgi:chromate transporter
MSPLPAEERPQPKSLTDLFISFTLLALQGFGGVLAVVQRELVERKLADARGIHRGLGGGADHAGPQRGEPVADDRRALLRPAGALAALAGMLAVPLVLVLLLAVLYAQFAGNPGVAGALRGMAAVAAGLIGATGLKLLGALKQERAGPAWLRALGLRRAFVAGRAAAHSAGLCAAGPGRRGLRAGLPQAGAAMNEPSLHVFGARDWFDLFLHYLSLSLLSVGGAISTAPDMHRFLVDKQHWLTDAQFNASIAIAQAAPGPNVLFVA